MQLARWSGFSQIHPRLRFEHVYVYHKYALNQTCPLNVARNWYMLDAVIQLLYETKAKLVNANDVYYYV